jgi:transcriptional regulator
MYIPAAFQQPDSAKLFEFIEQNSFGLLVSQSEGEPFASHLPMLLDRTAGPHGTLIGHMALANGQWQQADGQQVLAVFAGPHAYISPTWYESENVVPTWNYVAVHVYGRLQVVHDGDALAKILQDFVRFYESSLPRPWTFDSNSDFAKKFVKGVAGFRVEISQLEGKWKLGQNRTPQQRENAIRALRSQPDENSQAIAALMTEASRGA